MTDAQIPEQLHELAPKNLTSQAAQRYDGGGFNVSLNDFAPEDVSLILQLYSTVKKTYDLWLYMRESPNYKLIASHIDAEINSRKFLSSTRAIGVATYSLGEPEPLLRKVAHDIRGGALGPLVGYSDMFELHPDKLEEYAKRSVLLARDHAKLMRNAITDLDETVREADESLKVHYIDDFVDKWDGSKINIGSKKSEVAVTCTFHGSITNRCLETSAIDRVLYNYINNAARFTQDGEITLHIFDINDSVVRWVVGNTISEKQREWLEENTGLDLKQLFEGGKTRGGHGIGLSNCADFVGSSFGITAEEALQDGYLGAELIEDTYYAWFHWPAYHPKEDDPGCKC